jgi:hypothetical protein
MKQREVGFGVMLHENRGCHTRGASLGTQRPIFMYRVDTTSGGSWPRPKIHCRLRGAASSALVPTHTET